MAFQRVVGIGISILMASSAAAGQQTGATTDQPPQVPANSVVETTYPAGGVAPARRLQSRSASDNREVATERVEMPGINDRWEPHHETVTEIVKTGTNGTQIQEDLFSFGPQRERRLVQTTRSVREVSADGSSNTVHDTSVADVNGRMGLTSRQLEQISVSPNIRQSETTRLETGTNGRLQESERTQELERLSSQGVTHHDSTRMVRDLNGRWQRAETRSREIRADGSERVEEETIQRRDVSGNLTTTERSVTRRSNGQEDELIETYAPIAEGLIGSGTRLGLSQRVRRMTTRTADGGRQTVEEIEMRSMVASNEPMRLVRRSVVTVRRTGSDRWTTERQVFDLDVNGRLVPVTTETEE
jgi:hypothetical protein